MMTRVKNRVLILALAAALVVTGMAFPAVAYGAEAEDAAAQPAAEQTVTEETTEATTTEAPAAEAQAEEATTETVEVSVETLTESAPAAEAPVTLMRMAAPAATTTQVQAVSTPVAAVDNTASKFKAARNAVYGSRTGNTTSAKLTWTKIAGADGYVLYRYNYTTKKYATCKVLNGANALSATVWVPANANSRFAVRGFRTYNGKKIWTSYGAYKTIPQVSKSIRILNTGKGKMGSPYVYGAAGPYRFDCSGFVMYVMRQHGYRLPHSAASQYYALRSKSIGTTNWRKAQAGDIVFYSYGGPGSSHHVGIYAGNGKLLHASSGRGCVTITPISYSGGHIAAICRP